MNLHVYFNIANQVSGFIKSETLWKVRVKSILIIWIWIFMQIAITVKLFDLNRFFVLIRYNI